MRKNLGIALLVAVMAGAFAGVGQAAVIYADSAIGSADASNMIGTPNGDFATLAAGGTIYLTFGGYFQDKPTGADFALYFSNPQNTEPYVSVSAQNIGGTWVNMDFFAGAGNVRTFEIAGTGTEYYNMIRITPSAYLNGATGGLVTAPAAPVPEPGTMMLLGSGLVGLAVYGRKKFRK